MNDKELIQIVNQAIPLSDCAIKRSHEIWRREKLKTNIKKLISKELSQQFNAVEQT